MLKGARVEQGDQRNGCLFLQYLFLEYYVIVKVGLFNHRNKSIEKTGTFVSYQSSQQRGDRFMEFFMSILPLIFWMAITVIIFWVLFKAFNISKPKSDLEQRVEILEEEIRKLKNNK
ncbi:hypothetical protein [Oceanobacillus chungangensis]|uniref:DUF4083 domain-containing protein n=1 Tax=Oceanobacillus chungangensis TaxID=1229152 RepID=A0A3D8PII7_9BACI|nr:hypothetical protein [Oceanobacillus chungangensis]RDW14995.1 hypothetical protein CWR45_19245 [Oceanobacillus chungangensis]